MIRMSIAVLAVATLAVLVQSRGPANASTSGAPALSCTTVTRAQDIGNYQVYCYKSNGHETLTGTSATSWHVTAEDTAGYPYPDARVNGIPASSSFRIGMPTGNYNAEAAYDVCQDGCSSTTDQEMMIWVDNHGEVPWPGETKVRTYDGWTLYRHSATHYVWEGPNETFGTVNLSQMISYTGMRDLNTAEFGWEIHDTDGVKTFTLDSLSI